MKSSENLFFRRESVLPIFLSTELSECGLACLAMIGVYHGHDFDLNSLRQKFSISILGSSLRGLMNLADHLGLASRALRVEMSALERISMPAIIHWDLNHYVVLKSVSRKSAVIHDPARGKVTLSLEEFSNHFTGVVLELSPVENFEKLKGRSRFSVTDLFSRISGHRTAIGYVLLLSVALQALSFIMPSQMQLIVDKAIDADDRGILMIVTVAFGALLAMNTLISAMRNWTLQLLSSQLVYQVAGNLFRHLIRLSASFFEKRHLGDILSRLGSIRQIQDAVTQGILAAIIDGSMAILAAASLFLYSPMLAMIIVGTVFAYGAVTVMTYPLIRRQTEKVINATAREQSYLMESIRGIVPLKLMGGETVRESTWRNLFGRSFNETLALTRIQQKIKVVEELTFGLQLAVILYLATMMILDSRGFSIGMLFSFMAFRAMFTDRVLILIRRALEFGMLNLYVYRLGDFLAESPELEAGGVVELEVGGQIELQDISFRYGATDPFVLTHTNLVVQPGDFVAIVGPTGGGKTTLLKLMLGLQTPTQGRVLFDGEPAGPSLWQAWRSQVGVVRQDDQLFSGTLAENIAFFDPDMDMMRVRKAATAARVNGDIDKMPMKYLTLVGDMGSSLSGGQRQRILLARALYRSPKVLILDEGTANLDPATEEFVSDMIAELDITRIVVAHRPALVERANRVIKVDNGTVEVIRDRAVPARLMSRA